MTNNSLPAQAYRCGYNKLYSSLTDKFPGSIIITQWP